MGLTEVLFNIDPVQIGVGVDILTVDATLSEEHTSEADITDHPVEKGADVTDHIRKKPAQIRLTGVVSNTPLEFLSFDAGLRAEAAWDKLLELQRNQTLTTVVTTLATYENMALVSLTCPRDAQRGNVIEFTAMFREITTAESKVVNPPDTPRPKRIALGNKATGQATAVKRQSLLNSIATSVASFFGG